MANKDLTVDLHDFENFTIAAAASLSDGIDLKGMTPCGIHMPAAFTGTGLKLKVSVDGVNFLPVYNDAGDEVVFTVAAGRYVMLDPTDLVGMRYVKLESNDTEVAERVISLALRQVN